MPGMGGYATTPTTQRPTIATTTAKGPASTAGGAFTATAAAGAPGVVMYPTSTGGVTYVATSAAPPTAEQINSLLERTRQRLRADATFRDFTASVRAARHSHTGQLIENTARGALQSGFNIVKGVGSSFLSALTGTPQTTTVGAGSTVIIHRGGAGSVVTAPAPPGAAAAGNYSYGYGYGYGYPQQQSQPQPQQQQQARASTTAAAPQVAGAPGTRGGVRCPRCSNILLHQLARLYLLVPVDVCCDNKDRCRLHHTV